MRHDLALAGAGDDGPHVTVRRRDTTVSARMQDAGVPRSASRASRSSHDRFPRNPADPELSAMRERAGDLCTRFNALPRGDHAGRAAVLDELLPPMHPIRFQDRNVRRAADGSYYDYEYGKPIVIGSNCWFGGNVTVVGGVTIGEGCVIGAGSARPRHQILGQDLTANRYRGRPVQSSPV
ncbi:acetyltransferase [Bifidobacterium bifidum]|uniref:Acetyltransferase n=3 Tax=Bifidobacterium bifidum TaxID=1681 RepID=A0AB36C0K7_BIFBI|nr:acetyltransferase [Bifidobacterium bifidum]